MKLSIWRSLTLPLTLTSTHHPNPRSFLPAAVVGVVAVLVALQFALVVVEASLLAGKSAVAAAAVLAHASVEAPANDEAVNLEVPDPTPNPNQHPTP